MGVAGAAALCDLIASAYLAVAALSSGPRAYYVGGPAVGSTFLGLAWGAVGSRGVPPGLLGWQWCVENRIQEWEDGMRRGLVGGAPPP